MAANPVRHQMKLEDLPKKQPFNVPDGYFDDLPQRIQKRISSNERSYVGAWFIRYKLHYALSVIVLVVLAIWWMPKSETTSDVESMLATVETEELLNFLDQSELTTEELLQHGSFSSEDAENIESEVYQIDFEDAMVNDILDEIELENL